MKPHPAQAVPVFDPDGALSSEYLRNRGHCCENGCRNCPYGFGRTVSNASGPLLPVSSPHGRILRIVSLCPSNTEIVHALGALSCLVGVDDWSDWPPQVRFLPRVGPDLNVVMDRVVALCPDLVLASLSVPGMERNIRGLRERGIPHLVLDPHGFDDIWSNIRQVGGALGIPDQAETTIQQLIQRTVRVEKALAAVRNRPKLYWEWWPKPLFAPGGRNWLTELSRLAGAESITADIDADCACPTPDEVLNSDPDWILLAWTGVSRERVRPDVVRRRPGWSQMRAVREGRVVVLEEGRFCRPSPRLIDGLEQLAGMLHPQLFVGAGA